MGLLHAFLLSALDGGEWSASRCGRYTPGSLWIRAWVGTRSGLDAMVKRKKNPCPCRESNPGRPARSLVTKKPRMRPVGRQTRYKYVSCCTDAVCKWNSVTYLPSS